MKRQLGFVTATSLVVASMIGTGVFTTTGFLVRDVSSTWAVLACWVVGGVTALCGALSYAELTTALPDNGGEYYLLSRIYHPAVGMVAGWASLIVGFSAPTAAGAIALGKYLAAVFPGVPALPAGTIAVVLISVLHAKNVSAGSRFQNAFTIAKVALIVAFVVAGLFAGDPGHLLATSGRGFAEATLSLPFAIGLIYVAFAYSGWNAAAYVAGEVERPQRVLPAALVVGTAIVTALYVGLNVVFLAAAPPEALAGVVEVGYVASVHLYGEGAGRVLSAIIALGLVSTLGAFVMTGARVLEAMGRDHPRLGFVTGRSTAGGPIRSVVAMAVLSIAMMWTAGFDTLLTYTGFTISIGLALTVLGVVVLRVREPGLARPYRTWGYPLTPIVYLVLATWMIASAIVQTPIVALAGLATIASGLLLYFVTRGPR